MVAHSDVRGLLQQHGYTEIKKVGEGSFGKAILVASSDGSKMICKMVDVSKASNKERQDAIKEGQLLSSLKHPYIVRYRDCFTDTGWLCILMDFCEGGEVAKQIQDHRRAKKPLPEEQIMKWFTQAILALNYIHDKHILHRDLKPQNFFLSNNNMKMGDFGIAKVLACTIAVAKTQIGTPYYLSPEVCQEKPYSWGSDVWAMGCILYEFCALQVPFDATNITGLVQKIVKGPIPTVPTRYSDFLRRLVSEMLNRNPDRRPSTDDILEMSQVKAVAKQEMQDGGNDGPQAPPPAAGPSVNADGRNQDAAGSYKKDDLIEYNSSAHKQWLPAVVLNVDGQGRIIMDLKPNTWLTKEEQAQKIRPRSGLPGAGPENLRVAASPMRGRTPSADPGGRAPSRGGGRETPMRQESPRQNAPWRVASPSRGRGPSLDPPGSRCGTPSRQRTPSVDRLLGAPAPAGPPPGSAVSRNSSSMYRKGDMVEFYSNSHKDWLAAVVTNVDDGGRILIDLKPNTWITRDEQVAKVRPRLKNPPPSRGASPGPRCPSRGSLHGGREPSPGPGRIQSPGIGFGGAPPFSAGNARGSPKRPPMPRDSPLRQGGRHIAGL